jgi:bifunctional non-homologous end joining protein LigD
MVLDEYRQKRRFERTPEPENSSPSNSQAALHFVVHKHNARRLHYDLRLELEGVLKSWAVPKGPSMDPSDKRLAMMVEDHPLDYRNFEGVIPKGNYGAGEVIIWDAGVYSSLESADRVISERSIKSGLHKGHVSFLLQGEKLKGVFDLIKLKNDEETDNSWLLVKRPDEFAGTEEIAKKDRSIISGQTIENLKNGRIDLANLPRSAMQHKISPMLSESSQEPFNKEGWIFEIKLDGYRAISEVSDNNVNLYSRNDISFNDAYPLVIRDLQSLKGKFVLDGEIVALNEDGIPKFQYLQNRDMKNSMIVYYVFDILYYDEYDLRSLPLFQRKQILKRVLPKLDHVIYTEHLETTGKTLYEKAVSEGFEGIIGKDKMSAYRQGRRSSDWVKIKAKQRQEAIIGGFTAPRGGGRPFGALVLGIFESGKLKYIGHTGGGLNDHQLRDLYKKMTMLKVEHSPFEVIPQTNENVTWVKPKLVCEVEFQNWTDEGHMRQPVFLGLRFDKEPTDVQKEVVQQQFAPEIEERETVKVNGKILTISNLSKVYWPKKNIKKAHLVEYYSKISDIIIPHLKDRPESMLRNPDGFLYPGFFQKNSMDNPEWVRTIGIRSDTESRTINYILCNDPETLIYMVNLGCIEINPWLSRVGSLDRPDFMVIDIDPHEIDFKFAVEAALVTKQVLKKLGIVSYCKSSGKAGLHIFCPTGTKYSYEQIRNISEIVARLVHKRLPKSTSVVRNPKERVGKVYLDFLQNRQGQTMASAYSVRPVEDATVSTPLRWDEVTENLSPKKFFMEVVENRIKEMGDIWADVLNDKGFDLEEVLTKIPYEQE